MDISSLLCDEGGPEQSCPGAVSDVGTGPDNNMPFLLDRCCPAGRPASLVQAACLGRTQLFVARASDALDGAEILEGGPLSALFRCNGAKAVRFTVSTDHYEGKRMSLSPVSRSTSNDAARYISCNVRKDSKFLRTKGVLSAWKGQGGFGLMWSDPQLVCDFVAEQWGLSHEDRNRLMHALNGNGGKKKNFKRRHVEGRDEAVVNTTSFPVSAPKTNAVCASCGQHFVATPDELALADMGFESDALLCPACHDVPVDYSRPRPRVRDRSMDVRVPPAATPPPPRSPPTDSRGNSAPGASDPPSPPPPAPLPRKHVSFGPDPPQEPPINTQLIAECVYGDSVRGCFGRACGTVRDDGPAIHFGGLDDPRAGDEVFTIEFEEFAEQIPEAPCEMAYRRVGADYGFVEGEHGVVEAADWMFEPGCVRHYRSLPLDEALRVVPFADVLRSLSHCRFDQWLVSASRVFVMALRLLCIELLFVLFFIGGPIAFSSMDWTDGPPLSVSGSSHRIAYCDYGWWVVSLVMFSLGALGLVLRSPCLMGSASFAFAVWCGFYTSCDAHPYFGPERIFVRLVYAHDEFGLPWSQWFTAVVLLVCFPLWVILKYVQAWLDDREGVCCNSYLRAVLLQKIPMDPPFYRFALRETFHSGRPCRRRFSSYTTPNGCVSMFRGRKRAVVWYLDHVVEVSASILGETLRYFSSDLPAKVCASHITGHLKNSDATSEQIHACIAAASAHHGKHSVEYAKSISPEPTHARRWPSCLWVLSIALVAWFGHGLCLRSYDLERSVLNELYYGSPINGTVSVASIFYRRTYVAYESEDRMCVNVTVFVDRTWEHLGLYRFLDRPFNGTHCFNNEVSQSLREYFSRSNLAEVNFWNAYSHYVTQEGILDHSRRLREHSRLYAQGLWCFVMLWLLAYYECSIAPWWEERFKASKGWPTVFVFVAAEAAVRWRGLASCLFYLKTTGLAHCFFYGWYPFTTWLRPRRTAVPDAHFRSAYYWHKLWNCAFSVPNFLFTFILIESLSRTFLELERTGASWWDVGYLWVECWCYEASRYIAAPEMVALIGKVPDWFYQLFDLAIRYPVYNNVEGLVGSIFTGSASVLVVQAWLYVRGMDSWFKDVPAMGRDSRFVEHFRSGSVPVREDCGIKVKRGRRQRGRNSLLRLMPEFVPAASFAGNNANALHSLCGRVVNSTPDCRHFPLMTAELVEEIATRMVERGPIRIVESSEWAGSFPPAKRKRYLFSLERLAVYGLSWFYCPFDVCTKWYKRSCFIKHEANLCQLDKRTESGFIACADPRTIQASTDEVQALFGPSFVSYGQRAAEVFDGSEASKINGWRVLFGFGRTKSEVSQYCDEMAACGERAVIDCGDDSLIVVGGRVYAVDAKRWDAHIRRPLLEIKTLHLRRLGMSEQMMHILVRMIKRRGTYTGLGVGFEVDGNVASGDPDTLYWNTVLGVALIISCFDGCDSFEKFEDRARELGVEYELAGSAHVGFPGRNIDFCSCVIAPTTTGWTFAPKLGRYLMKLGVSAIRGNPVNLLSSKLRGAICDLAAYPEVVYQLCRLSSKLPTRDAVSESYFPVGKCDPGSYDERCTMFAERYGVSYGTVVDEVAELVDSTLDGRFERGDLVTLRKLVAVDYGKEPLETPVRSVRRVRWSSVALFFLAVVGGAGILFGARSSLTKFNPVSWPGVMAGKKNSAKQKKRNNVSNGKKAPKLKGSGSYQMAANLAAGAVANSLKGMLAKHLPAGTFERAGARIGAKLGRGLSNISGVGDYVVNDTFVNNSNNMKNGLTPQTISNCEYAFELTADGSPGFDVFRQLINPTNSNLFPWLSRIARLYTKYRFTQLVFEYRSTSSDYAAGGGLGSVIFAPQYNINLEAFPTKQIMQAATHAVSTKPSNGMLCGLECSPKDQNFKWLLVRNSNEQATPMTDMGWFNWALYGCPASNGVGIGEVWVHYTCELIEPVIARDLPVVAKRCVLTNANGNLGVFAKAWGYIATGNNTQDITYNTGLTGANMITKYQTSVPTVPYDLCFLSGGDNDRLYFGAPGLYVIDVMAQFVTAYAGTVTTAITAGGSGGSIVLGPEVYSAPGALATDRKIYNFHQLVLISAKDDYITINVTGTASNLSVVQYVQTQITRLTVSS